MINSTFHLTKFIRLELDQPTRSIRLNQTDFSATFDLTVELYLFSSVWIDSNCKLVRLRRLTFLISIPVFHDSWTFLFFQGLCVCSQVFLYTRKFVVCLYFLCSFFLEYSALGQRRQLHCVNRRQGRQFHHVNSWL